MIDEPLLVVCCFKVTGSPPVRPAPESRKLDSKLAAAKKKRKKKKNRETEKEKKTEAERKEIGRRRKALGESSFIERPGELNGTGPKAG